MEQYTTLVRHILQNGEKREDRTGTGTISVFGYQMRFDLREGFPILTTKKIPFNSVVRELLWFLSGSTNVKDLHPCKIWDEWADEDGELGPIYGKQWREWHIGRREDGVFVHCCDQILSALEMIKRTPTSRRIIVSAWNVGDIATGLMALPPCHLLFQFYVGNIKNGECSSGEFLDLHLYQRSCDVALGVPFNISSYALLLELFAKECRLKPRFLIHTLGDAHIYKNHIDLIRDQIERPYLELPRIVIAPKDVLKIKFEDIKLLDYEPHQSVKYEISV